MIFWVFWIVGAMFTDGLKDPLDIGGFKEGIVRFFRWPWELGQYVRVKLDGEDFLMNATPAAPKEDRSEMNWQPIKTAPKDGTTIILLGKTKHAAWDFIETGHWYRLEGGKWLYHHYIGDEPRQPTHWMPLPAAPKMED